MARILLQWRQRNTSATADSLYQPKRPRQEKALITCWLSGFSRRGQQVRHRPPQTAWCFPSLLEIPLPRLHHLAPGNCSIKTTTRNRKCVVIVSCMFHVSQTPTSFVGDSAEFRPPPKKIRAEELLGSPGGCRLCYHLIESQRRLLHWTVHLNGDEVWKWIKWPKWQEGIVKSYEINDFPVGLKKTTWLKFCVKESNPTLPYSTKNCWSLKRCLRSRSPRPGFMGIPTKDAPGVSFTGSFVHFFGIGNTRSQGNIERVLRKDK